MSADRFRQALLVELVPLALRLAARAGADWRPPDVEGPLGSTPLDDLSARLSLTPFERQVLVLCVGVELDGRLAPLISEAQVDPAQAQATVGLALSLLDDAHLDAFHPDAPLRRWGLVHLDDRPALTRRGLRLDERLLFHLLGYGGLDEALSAQVHAVASEGALVASHRALAEALTEALRSPTQPVVQLQGVAKEDALSVVGAAGEALGCATLRARVEGLPDPAAFARAWSRELLLRPLLLLLEAEGESRALETLCEQIPGPIVLLARTRLDVGARRSVALPLHGPDREERARLLAHTLGTSPGEVRRVADQFHLSASALRDACAEAQLSAEGAVHERLWRACRLRARPSSGQLATRVDSGNGFDDLVLPGEAREHLRELLRYARHLGEVADEGGFGSKGGRGLGITALFAGASGTGKTMAAEVIANALELDLYRVDLSAMVSKYIGETEKNLSSIFDAADSGGFVLLFDEADALFGKRGEVKDSHDRYANIEVSYLLQRMEAYRGVAVLTTNLRENLDSAFLRRLRVIVDFPFPDREARLALWARAFPARTRTQGLDLARLAQLKVAGGNIRNIALDAAIRAAELRQPVRMEHILPALRREYRKLDREPTSSELRGW